MHRGQPHSVNLAARSSTPHVLTVLLLMLSVEDMLAAERVGWERVCMNDRTGSVSKITLLLPAFVLTGETIDLLKGDIKLNARGSALQGMAACTMDGFRESIRHLLICFDLIFVTFGVPSFNCPLVGGHASSASLWRG